LVSQKLTLLDRNVPLDTPLENLSYQQAEIEKVNDFLHKMNFKSLIQRFSKNFTVAIEEKAPPVPFQYTLVTNINDLTRWIEQIKTQKWFAFDTETTSLNPDEAQLVGVSFALTPEQGCYVPLGHIFSSHLFENNQSLSTQIPLQDFLALFAPLLQDPSILKIGHNIKYDCRVLQKYQISLKNVEDTMLMSYVLEEGLHNLDSLVTKHFGHSMMSFKEVIATVAQKEANFSHVSLDKACYYAAEDAVYTLRLYNFYHNLLNQPEAAPLKYVYSFIEIPLIPILCAIEQRGVYIDADCLKKLSLEWEERLQILEQQIYQQAGRPFLIGSPKQLGTVLFEELGLGEKIKKGKSGIPSTNADVLEDLAQQGHLLPQLVLEWRQLAKLKSTYTEALIKQINPDTQRVHTSFLMAGTTTGRLASSDPNLQNIPIRTEEGKKIRHAFQAQTGNQLISADYSQIELRLLTHFAEVPHLQEAFKNQQDIHALTASQIFRLPLEKVTPDRRRQAKAINFGIIYGISPFGLSKQLGIPTGMASEIIKAYFAEYPGINAYMEQMIKHAQSQGYVTTLYGRRCFIPGIKDKNAVVRSMSQRQAINAPLQGSNADIIKKAMIALPLAFKEENLTGKIILQVHDELIFEIPEAEVSPTAVVIKKIMEGIAPELRIPLVIEIGVGKTWESAH
jgi:DNA polymerase-1